MDLKLKGMRALVAGSSRGLGYATALGLAREGAAVALNSRDPATLAAAAQKMSRETGVEVIAAAGDVTDPAMPEALVALAVSAFGGLDLLVTNTGGPPSAQI